MHYTDNEITVLPDDQYLQMLRTALGSWEPAAPTPHLTLRIWAEPRWRTRGKMFKLLGEVGRIVEENCSGAHP